MSAAGNGPSNEQTIARQVRREFAFDRYGAVIILILATILSTAFVGDKSWGLVVTLVLMSVTMNVTLRTSNASRNLRIVGAVVSVLTILGLIAALLFGNEGPARVAYGLAMIALVLVTPVVIARRVAEHTVVTLSTVTAAAAIYLLLGLLFSVVFNLIGVVLGIMAGNPGAAAFFVASRPIVPSDFVYYSFTTLTTVGYGDLTASVPVGRLLSNVEALIGQLYLVTIVALLVSNLGRSRRPVLADDSVDEEQSAD